MNRFFVSSSENNAHQACYKRYIFPIVETKDYNFMIDGRYAFDNPIRNSKKTYEIIAKIATGQGDDYANGYLLD